MEPGAGALSERTGDRVRPIALVLLVLATFAVSAGGAEATSAQTAAATHRFSGAPTDFLVDGSERTLNFLLIAQTPAGTVLAQAVIDPTGQWALDVPAPPGVTDVVFLLAEPGDPISVRGTAAPLPLVAGGDTRLTELRFQSPLPPAFDISGDWEFLVTVTQANGACRALSSTTSSVAISQLAGEISLVGLGGPNTWFGTVAGDQVNFAGTRPEDGGTTTAVFSLTLSTDGHGMTGSESWSWVGPGGPCTGGASIVSATQVLIPPDQIVTTFDVAGDAQSDADGVFFEATTPDGAVTIQVRDLPPGIERVDLLFFPLAPADLVGFSPREARLIGEAAGIPAAGEVLIFDAETNSKIDATVDVILAPLDVPDVQFLLWLVEGPDGNLRPVEFRAAVDGRLRARFAFDLVFIILDMPAPEANLRAGLNAVVYTGPQMPADRAFPGGPGRGAGLEALWRFTGFGFEAFFPSFPELVVPTYRLYDPLFVVASVGGALMQQGLLVSVRRTVSLAAGDNMVSYTGGGGSILNVIDAAVVARTRAIWVWRDSVGAWLGFFPGQPAAIQGITALALRDLIFMNTSGAVGWDMR